MNRYQPLSHFEQSVATSIPHEIQIIRSSSMRNDMNPHEKESIRTPSQEMVWPPSDCCVSSTKSCPGNNDKSWLSSAADNEHDLRSDLRRRRANSEPCPLPSLFHMNEDEKRLQKRRSICEASIKKLYEERKDHIDEIFQSQWIVSNALEDFD